MDRRMVFSADDMSDIVERIEAAQRCGEMLNAACDDWGISQSTFFRWRLRHPGSQPRVTGPVFRDMPKIIRV